VEGSVERRDQQAGSRPALFGRHRGVKWERIVYHPDELPNQCSLPPSACVIRTAGSQEFVEC
jgi:hypothetical protein